MVYKCNTLGKEFVSRAEMFKELKTNEEKIIGLKKKFIQKSFNKGQFAPSDCIVKDNDILKEAVNFDSDYIYPIINTTKYLDMHDDVHWDGLWNRTIKEKKGTIHYTADHQLKVRDIIAWPEDVEVFVKMISWGLVGKSYKGETQALFFKIKKTSLKNKEATEAINEQRKLQNSVRMRYYKITLAINSEEKEYADNKAYYDANIDKIANIEKAEEQGYFFGVEEAAIIDEGSLVIKGSNDATSIVTQQDSSSSQSEKDSGSPQSNKKDTRREFLLKLLKKS